MSLFAIGDLHLSLGKDKPMDIFGSNWKNHYLKIKTSWLNLVKNGDTVLLLGDISWGINLDDARLDLNFINELPGKKIIIMGNHDYWWNSVSKLNKAYPEIKFLKNDFAVYEDYAICGTRGWICPNSALFTENDYKIYLREQNRLRLSLNKACENGYKKIIAITHYPPTNDKKEESGFTKIFKEYKVEKVFYGHLHGKNSFYASLIGTFDEIEYDLVSADFLNFNIKKVL